LLAVLRQGRHRSLSVFPRAFASEFPHDNPEISDGVTWLSPSVCAPPLPCATGTLLRGPGLRRARRSVPAVSVVPAPSAVSDAPKAAPPEPENAFQRFLQAMVRAALAEGATQVAAELPLVLGQGRLRPWTFDDSVQRALRARGYLAADGSAASVAFRTVADAWRSVLDGSSQDLSACGDKTLDEWGSSLLAALLGRAPQSAEELRRALRRAGVAAFGMREAA
jgi:hypothetical protein